MSVKLLQLLLLYFLEIEQKNLLLSLYFEALELKRLSFQYYRKIVI